MFYVFQNGCEFETTMHYSHALDIAQLLDDIDPPGLVEIHNQAGRVYWTNNQGDSHDLVTGAADD